MSSEEREDLKWSHDMGNLHQDANMNRDTALTNTESP
ncbi:hypothetical protein X975_05195, partial [Stegodyphus mimosarum]